MPRDQAFLATLCLNDCFSFVLCFSRSLILLKLITILKIIMYIYSYRPLMYVYIWLDMVDMNCNYKSLRQKFMVLIFDSLSMS